jgi:hypothetical protein
MLQILAVPTLQKYVSVVMKRTKRSNLKKKKRKKKGEGRGRGRKPKLPSN